MEGVILGCITPIVYFGHGHEGSVVARIVEMCQSFCRRLRDSSDDQGKGLTQIQAMLSEWISTYKCKDSILTQRFGKSKESCSVIVSYKRNGGPLPLTDRVFRIEERFEIRRNTR